MNVNKLIDYFSKILPLNNDEIAAVKLLFKERRIKRRQFILQEGDVCKLNTFVIAGCFRMFFVDENGKEHNIQFAIENWWIGDLGSFHSENPSKLYIEALENSTVLQIKKKDQISLFVNQPKFNLIFRVFTENALVGSQRRVLQNISSTAEERYVDFINRYPLLANRVSNVQIASFIGVTPEFLSKLKKSILSK